MAYFAELDENNIVLRVVSISNSDIVDPHTGAEDEILSTSVARWEAPISKPALTEEEVAAGKFYIWNEEAYQADTNDPKTVGWAITTF